MDWFAVRHVIKHQDAYEERVTLWQASSAEDAIARAEAEAAEYSWEGTEPLPLYQAYRLAAEPADGVEVFSLIRRSALDASDYLNAFFDTGGELQEHVEP